MVVAGADCELLLQILPSVHTAELPARRPALVAAVDGRRQADGRHRFSGARLSHPEHRPTRLLFRARQVWLHDAVGQWTGVSMLCLSQWCVATLP